MGQRYEKNKKNVSENKRTIENLREEKNTLQNEYAPMSLLDSIESLLDDEVTDAVDEVRVVGQLESQRIETETDAADAEKEKIADEIEQEIAKLDAGLDKLRQGTEMKFGRRAVEQSGQEYKKQIDKFKDLLEELGDGDFRLEHTDSPRDGFDNAPIETGDGAHNTESVFQTEIRNATAPIFGNDLYGNDGSFVPLFQTLQQSEIVYLGGQPVKVFDHPFDENLGRVCKQGTAFPDDGMGNGITGTCGCCACGTIINKAGGTASEKSVVTYAIQNNLARNRNDVEPSSRGGTSPSDWVGILGGAGITSRDTTGASLEDLAEQVEQGHGVIIGVSACTYLPEWYGHYMPGRADGHALVLESTIRDPSSGEILEYVVSDSNGATTHEACKRVSAKVLEKAFRRRNGQSVVTNEVIW